jgi:hypothetical protein
MRILPVLLLAAASVSTSAATLSAQPVVTPATPGTRTSGSTAADTLRPFGTLRDQAFKQQQWLNNLLKRQAIWFHWQILLKVDFILLWY